MKCQGKTNEEQQDRHEKKQRNLPGSWEEYCNQLSPQKCRVESERKWEREKETDSS